MREGAKGHSMKHSIAAQCEAPPFFVSESEAALHSMESARPRSNTEKPLARSLAPLFRSAEGGRRSTGEGRRGDRGGSEGGRVKIHSVAPRHFAFGSNLLHAQP